MLHYNCTYISEAVTTRLIPRGMKEFEKWVLRWILEFTGHEENYTWGSL